MCDPRYRLMSRFRACAAVLSAVITGSALQAQTGVVSLEAMARDWTGSSIAPRCTADAEPDPGGPTKRCDWPILPRGRGVLHVAGRQSPNGQLALLTREEDVTDRAAALRLRDSLSVSLRAAGLREYRCPEEDRQWRSAHATVHLLIGATLPNGLLRIAILATTESASVPDFACPGAVPAMDR